MAPCIQSHQLLSQSSWCVSSRTPNLRTTEYQTTRMYDNSQRSPNRIGWLLDYFKENVVRGTAKWMAPEMRMAGTWRFADRGEKKLRNARCLLFWKIRVFSDNVRGRAKPAAPSHAPCIFRSVLRANCGKDAKVLQVCSYNAKPISVVRLFVDRNERPVWWRTAHLSGIVKHKKMPLI